MPASWPVVDGNHTPFCSGPFPDKPTAFLGPNLNGAPSCPYVAGTSRPRDGVWLAPGNAPVEGHEIRTSTGQSVYEEPDSAPVEVFEYHAVQVEIGIGANPDLANRIVSSLRYDRGTHDSARTLVCSLGPAHPAMPRPNRLTKALVVNEGNITLSPPAVGEQPSTSAESAWARLASYTSPLERFQLFLATYSAKLPARLEPNGSLVPVDQNVLAWVVYSSPRSPAIQGCGLWGINAEDATSAQVIEDGGWAPGP